MVLNGLTPDDFEIIEDSPENDDDFAVYQRKGVSRFNLNTKYLFGDIIADGAAMQADFCEN